MRVLRLATVLVMISAVGCTGGSGSSSVAARLYSPVNGRIGFGMSGLTPGKHFSWGAIPLCLDRPGPVTVTSVQTVDPVNGLEVVAFAVRPYRNHSQGNYTGDLAGLGFSRTEIKGRTVSQVCGPEERGNVGLPTVAPTGGAVGQSELAITVTSMTAQPATTRSLRIGYTSGGKHLVASAAVSLALCPGAPQADCSPPT